MEPALLGSQKPALIVSFWKLGRCRFGPRQIHRQNIPPFRKIQDGTHKPRQVPLYFSAGCQVIIFRSLTSLLSCKFCNYDSNKSSSLGNKKLGPSALVLQSKCSSWRLCGRLPRPAQGRMEGREVDQAGMFGGLIFQAHGF